MIQIFGPIPVNAMDLLVVEMIRMYKHKGQFHNPPPEIYTKKSGVQVRHYSPYYKISTLRPPSTQGFLRSRRGGGGGLQKGRKET